MRKGSHADMSSMSMQATSTTVDAATTVAFLVHCRLGVKQEHDKCVTGPRIVLLAAATYVCTAKPAGGRYHTQEKTQGKHQKATTVKLLIAASWARASFHYRTSRGSSMAPPAPTHRCHSTPRKKNTCPITPSLRREINLQLFWFTLPLPNQPLPFLPKPCRDWPATTPSKRAVFWFPPTDASRHPFPPPTPTFPSLSAPPTSNSNRKYTEKKNGAISMIHKVKK